MIVGHYSPLGEELRSSVLGSDALDMFWFVDENAAFGGRAALWPLIKNAIMGTRKELVSAETAAGGCEVSDCGVSKVFVRSASLLRNSRVIPMRHAESADP